MPKSHSEGQFLSDIPRRGHQSDGGEERAFGETDGETGTGKSSGASDKGEEDGGDGPAEPDSQR
jgi:hypothetical protein